MKKAYLLLIILLVCSNVFSQTEVFNGDVQIGDRMTTGFGKKLWFGDAGDNMDEIYFVRRNIVSDRTDFILNIGDDSNDKFVIGRQFWGEMEITPQFVFQTNGNMGIGVLDPTVPLDVNGIIKTKGIQSDGDLHVDGNQNLTKNLLISKNQSLFIGDASNLDRCCKITYYGDQTPGDTYFNYSESLFFCNGNKNNGVPIVAFSQSGNVGIGTLDTQGFKLAVNGIIRAKEIKVESEWADFVFKKDYKLPTLGEVKKHIEEKGTLPGIPSEKEVKANGINVGEVNALLLQKIEELTLYVIKQQEEIDMLKEKAK